MMCVSSNVHYMLSLYDYYFYYGGGYGDGFGEGDGDDAPMSQTLPVTDSFASHRRRTPWCPAAMSASANSARPSSFNSLRRGQNRSARYAGLRVKA